MSASSTFVLVILAALCFNVHAQAPAQYANSLCTYNFETGVTAQECTNFDSHLSDIGLTSNVFCSDGDLIVSVFYDGPINVDSCANFSATASCSALIYHPAGDELNPVFSEVQAANSPFGYCIFESPSMAPIEEYFLCNYIFENPVTAGECASFSSNLAGTIREIQCSPGDTMVSVLYESSAGSDGCDGIDMPSTCSQLLVMATTSDPTFSSTQGANSPNGFCIDVNTTVTTTSAPASSSGLTNREIAGIIIGSVILGLILIALLVVMIIRMRTPNEFDQHVNTEA